MSDEKLLMVEDEENVGLTLAERLKEDGFHVTWVKNCGDCRLELKNRKFDIAILDVSLPDGSGFDIAEWVRREQPSTSIIFLSAFGQPENRIKGLELGAEDFIVKPFHYRELLLRIRNGLKRAKYLSGNLTDFENHEILLGKASIHFANFQVRVDGEVISLTHKEWALLKFLVERRGNVVSRDEILNFVWSEEEFPTARTVDNFIVRLRKMIEINPQDPQIIKSIRGVGYQLV